MSNIELPKYKGALNDKKFDSHNSSIIRISGHENSLDQYVSNFESVVDPFIIDQIKITESKAYRRLRDKTQVVFDPESPHVRVRSIHTSETVNPAIISSDILGLNTELVKAICEGHDIGHAPAGHLFERISKEEFNTEFKHEIFSAIISVFIERNGSGLNLTKQTIGGILNHSQNSSEFFSNNQIEEYKLAMYSDKIAYIFSDINDLKRINKLTTEDLTKIDSIFPCDSSIGNNQRSRVILCINALVKESAEKGFISFENSEIAKNFKELKKYMYSHYEKLDSNLLKEVVKAVIGEVSGINGYDPILLTALMTDSEIKAIYQKIISYKRINIDDIACFGVGEIIKNGNLEGQTYVGLDLKLRQKLSN